MEILIILFLIVITILNFIIVKKFTSLSVIFSFFWVIICFFSVFHFFNLYTINLYIYKLILVGNIGVFCGNILGKGLFYKKNKFIDKYSKDIILSKVFYFFLVLAISLISIKIFLMLPSILRVGFGEARNIMQQDESLNLSGGLLILQVYFAFPYIRASVILLSIKYIREKNNSILLIFILSFLQFFSDGGRASIMNSLICIVYLLITYFKKISKAKRTKICSIGLIVAITIIYFTAERGVNILENAYTYYCGSLVYFSENFQNSYLFNEYLFGANSFQGIFRPIMGVLNLFGLKDPQFLVESNDFLMGVQNTVTYISPNIKINYFITCYGYFYKDFGVMGVYLISLISGIIFYKIDSLDSNSLSGISLKILFIQGVFLSMSKYFLSDYNFVMTMIFIILISKFSSKTIKIKY